MFFPKNVDDRDSTMQSYHFQIITLVTIKKNKVYRRSYTETVTSQLNHKQYWPY